MITFYLKRNEFGAGSTLGTLKTPAQTFQTCEDTVREVAGQPVAEWKIKGVTAIPAGTYPLILDMSTRFKKEMPHILDVEGFDGIRIHAGNSAVDTEGCILLGWGRGMDGCTITHSRKAMDDFMIELEMLYDSGSHVQIDIS